VSEGFRMLPFAIAYVAAALFMIVFDLIWLRTLGGAIFRAEIGEMLTDNPNIVAAVLFYLL